MIFRISAPVSVSSVPRGLRPAARVLLSGEVFTLRDMSLAKLRKRSSVVPLSGAAVYFCAPTRGGGSRRSPVSCGPTTSARMAAGIPFLVGRGVKIFIGKGPLPSAILRVIARSGGVYLTAVGGCGAYYSRFVKKLSVAAFPELGAEAVLKLVVGEMPLAVSPSVSEDKGFSKK
ncbi:MAG: fumarate hydratase [Elusimicrobia bacterium HGW-Elusimicrobia-1]|nr:MAG: fumarate hydratase [Elusimicrobia bacterium HGW-Elusimicrobia-1]